MAATTVLLLGGARVRVVANTCGAVAPASSITAALSLAHQLSRRRERRSRTLP
jgi:hypothetical protein